MTNRLPSTYYPQYFKQDIKLKTPSENPIAKALDNFMIQMSESLFLSTWQNHRDFHTLESKKNHLSNLGLEFNSLSENEIHAFFEKLPEITLESLANLYFGKTMIQKGYPYDKQHLTQKVSHTLVDREDSNIFFITYYDSKQSFKVNEFLRNTKKVISDDKSVVIALAPKKLNLKSGFSLTKDSLTGRRLACRTLAK